MLRRHALQTARFAQAHCKHRAKYSTQPLGIDKSVENNLKTETNKLSKNLNKFWTQIDLKKDSKDHSSTITLDSKPVRTPLGHNLTIPASKPTLSFLLLNEWANLPNLKIKPHSLPLTSIVARCIDLQKSLNKEVLQKATEDSELSDEIISKIGCSNREDLYPQLLRYLDTDTLLCFSPRAEFEGKLREEQDKKYLPIIAKVENFMNKKFPYMATNGVNTSENAQEKFKLQILDADLHGLRGNQQDNVTKSVAINYMDSLSLWDLVIFEKTVLSTKSFICGLLLLNNQAFDVSMNEIIRLSTMETLHQVDRWGEVEDTHDVDKRDISRNVNAASIVAYCDK
ncbi:hypothetical protein ACO0RG_001779 [Hanseniaspora osmophila]|uniref:Protein ATP12, mitochondrial n=1 Tax=Hanseniaspora osmophila TaxID=56408 RepID=A0A1E5RI93_9ASCO|nr:Protein ATP12, mitochondrial [Hanseniaspora osmophila]